jgi:membrane-associated protease RseP (regulator of RpoE activity)
MRLMPLDPASPVPEPPSLEQAAPEGSVPRRSTRWRSLATPALLFVATCLSVLWTGSLMTNQWRPPVTLAELASGWVYALPLMSILLSHEFGHYVAARIHRVPASLPHFLPLPVLSPFGTLGAVIAMPERIRSRNALLDIGAAGPLAGMAVALPVIVYGLTLSPVQTQPDGAYWQEGQSLLYWLLKYLVKGSIPSGYDVIVHPTALAGWVGLFVTMINLIPWGQLDGGHIAFALLGPLQNRIARLVRWGVFGFFLYNLVSFVGPVLLGQSPMPLGVAFENSLTWLVWFGLLSVMGRVMGPDHPPVEAGALSPARRGVAVLCLLLFILLFMPTPLASYPGAPATENLSSSAARTTSGT